MLVPTQYVPPIHSYFDSIRLKWDPQVFSKPSRWQESNSETYLILEAAQCLKELMGSILQFIETGRRLNILAPDIESFFDSDLLETFGYSAWFVCLRGNQFGFSPTSQTALEVETLSYPHLSQSDTQELREAWQREYVEQFFQLAPPPAQKKQMTNFETRLGEGTHVLYRSDSSNIVGHACWAEDQHALLNLKCVYFHQWIRKDTDASIRKEIHKHFFSTLLGQPYPAMSGIAAHNSKALHHFRNNGFSFPILSIRKETGDLNVC